MDQSSTLKSGNTIFSSPGHHVVWMPPGHAEDPENLDLRLVLLKNITRTMLKNLAERMGSGAMVPTISSSPESSSTNLDQSDVSAPRCNPPVIRRIQGGTAFLLLVSTIYFVGKYLPYIDARRNEVVEPAGSQDFSTMVVTVALIALWILFFVVLRLTCRFGFPVNQP